MKQSARNWHHKISKALVKRGFRQLVADDSVFIKGNSIQYGITVSMHVDDIILTGQTAELQAFKKDLSTEFEITSLGAISFYLGMEITRDRKNRTLTLSQRSYIQKILQLHRFNKQRRCLVKTLQRDYFNPSK